MSERGGVYLVWGGFLGRLMRMVKMTSDLWKTRARSIEKLIIYLLI